MYDANSTADMNESEILAVAHVGRAMFDEALTVPRGFDGWEPRVAGLHARREADVIDCGGAELIDAIETDGLLGSPMRARWLTCTGDQGSLTFGASAPAADFEAFVDGLRRSKNVFHHAIEVVA